MAIETSYKLFSTNFSYYSSETPTNMAEMRHTSPLLSHSLQVSRSIIRNKTKLINFVTTPGPLGQHSKMSFNWCLHLSMKQTMLSSHYAHSSLVKIKPLVSSMQSLMNLSRRVESMMLILALYTTKLHYHHGLEDKWLCPTQSLWPSSTGSGEQGISTKQNKLIKTLAKHCDTVDLSNRQCKRKFDKISRTLLRCP